MNSLETTTPVLGFAAYSGTGKTTLLTKIIPLLKQRNVRLGIIKHAHHNFDIDHPGKDSYQLRKSGAERMLIASKKRWALMVENDQDDQDPSLLSLIQKIDCTELDLILVEGFKHEFFPKIELRRAELKKDLLFPQDLSIIAIATDQPLASKENLREIKQLDINSPEQIATYICDNFLDKKSLNSQR